MTVRLNGKAIEIPDATTVESLLHHLGLAASPCAVEINAVLIPKPKHHHTWLNEHDVIEIVTLVGGG